MQDVKATILTLIFGLINFPSQVEQGKGKEYCADR
jgi:hypothetical protein